METVVKTFYTGDKAKVGNLCFDSGRLRVFVTYCGNCHAKLVMELDEAEQFANKYATCARKRKNRSLVHKLEKLK